MSGLQSVLEPSHMRETISKQPISNEKTQQKDPADVQRQQKHYKKNNWMKVGAPDLEATSNDL